MSNTAEETTSVRKEVVVPASPELAFEVFTARFGDWWPGHHLSVGAVEAYVLEPGEGGRWFERTVEGEECEWGRVLHWEPPRRLVLSWGISAAWEADPTLASEVEVTFEPTGDGTRVVLEHRHLDRAGEGWREMREEVGGDGGWGGILGDYLRLVESAA